MNYQHIARSFSGFSATKIPHFLSGMSIGDEENHIPLQVYYQIYRVPLNAATDNKLKRRGTKSFLGIQSVYRTRQALFD